MSSDECNNDVGPLDDLLDYVVLEVIGQYDFDDLAYVGLY